jgi:hypothetical protein
MAGVFVIAMVIATSIAVSAALSRLADSPSHFGSSSVGE